MKRPVPEVTTAADVLRSRLVTVTLAPGRAAPLGSVTMPAMLPYTAWACAEPAPRQTANDANNRRSGRRPRPDERRPDEARVMRGTPFWLAGGGSPRGGAGEPRP